MSIRELKKGDIPTLSKMVMKEWGRESLLDFKREVNESFNMEHRRFYVNCIDSRIRGLVGLSISEISYELWGITWLLVSQNDRDFGIGSGLVRFAEEITKKNSFLKICNLQLTTSIPRFYEKLGYRSIGKWIDDKGEKRFLMFKQIKSLSKGSDVSKCDCKELK